MTVEKLKMIEREQTDDDRIEFSNLLIDPEQPERPTRPEGIEFNLELSIEKLQAKAITRFGTNADLFLIMGNYRYFQLVDIIRFGTKNFSSKETDDLKKYYGMTIIRSYNLTELKVLAGVKE